MEVVQPVMPDIAEGTLRITSRPLFAALAAFTCVHHSLPEKLLTSTIGNPACAVTSAWPRVERGASTAKMQAISPPKIQSTWSNFEMLPRNLCKGTISFSLSGQLDLVLDPHEVMVQAVS